MCCEHVFGWLGRLPQLPSTEIKAVRIININGSPSRWCRAFSGRRECIASSHRPARMAHHGGVRRSGRCKVKLFQHVGDNLIPLTVPRSLHSKTCGLRLDANFKCVHRAANCDSCRIRSWVRRGHPPRCDKLERCHAGSTVIQSPGADL